MIKENSALVYYYAYSNFEYAVSKENRPLIRSMAMEDLFGPTIPFEAKKILGSDFITRGVDSIWAVKTSDYCSFFPKAVFPGNNYVMSYLDYDLAYNVLLGFMRFSVFHRRFSDFLNTAISTFVLGKHLSLHKDILAIQVSIRNMKKTLSYCEQFLDSKPHWRNELKKSFSQIESPLLSQRTPYNAEIDRIILFLSSISMGPDGFRTFKGFRKTFKTRMIKRDYGKKLFAVVYPHISQIQEKALEILEPLNSDQISELDLDNAKIKINQYGEYCKNTFGEEIIFPKIIDYIFSIKEINQGISRIGDESTF